MRRHWTLLTIAALGLGTAAYAQPPGGDRPRSGPGGLPNRERSREEVRERPRSDREGASHVDQWMRMLAEHMIDPHDAVRDSARAGLVAIGDRAVPMLRNLANGNDDARATAAKKVIEAIERSHRRPGAPANRPSSGGFGFGYPMGQGTPPTTGGRPTPFGRSPMTGGFPGGAGGFDRGGERKIEQPRLEKGSSERRDGDKRDDERRPEAPRPSERRPR